MAGIRIKRVLARRRVASLPQLQSKICEACPINQRPDPHHLSNAMTVLERSGKVKIVAGISPRGRGPQSTKLYAPADFDPANASDAKRLQEIATAYRDYF